jgi:hypothetical protein
VIVDVFEAVISVFSNFQPSSLQATDNLCSSAAQLHIESAKLLNVPVFTASYIASLIFKSFKASSPSADNWLFTRVY